MTPPEWLSNALSLLAGNICRGIVKLETKADADKIKTTLGELIDHVKKMFDEEEPP